MGAHVPSASRTPIGVAAANRKQSLQKVFLWMVRWNLTREFYKVSAKIVIFSS